ncbi:murein L,D-transpeptidase YcbB/YkuD [Tepidamorphus gemmatus]|uniref:Murein L,D-transpeptidase YcbB/YkuD n=1 Tax=Tepidamorphus gemmatus TaxID=747076 RepID=A0A4R3MI45_9HYPH|nr:murein L,D-transpeptidase YcbB/YkuD [Tepidamorphus gemmatus]
MRGANQTRFVIVRRLGLVGLALASVPLLCGTASAAREVDVVLQPAPLTAPAIAPGAPAQPPRQARPARPAPERPAAVPAGEPQDNDALSGSPGEFIEGETPVLPPALPSTAALRTTRDEEPTFADFAPAEPPAAAPEAAAAGDPEPPVAAAGPAASAEPSALPTPDPTSVALKELLAPTKGKAKDPLAVVATFYDRRGYTPLWLAGGRFTGSGRAVIHRLARADAYGLDPARYDLPPLDIGIAAPATPAALAEAEIALTRAALKFAADAQGGIMPPTALGDLVTARPTRPDPAQVLTGLAEASDKVAYLEGFNPPHPGFAALQRLLAELRDHTASTTTLTIPDGPSIKPGMSDERVPLLRRRLGLQPVEGEAALVYDEATVEAVKAFQQRATLEVDGVVGPQTLIGLNGGAEVTVADVLVNMERWRWLPRDMGELHVWVNIPEYRLRVMNGGRVSFETRVIVGTPKNQTPIFSDAIQYVDVNPYWNVPRSIAAKEMMPEILRDPGFFERRGLQVIYTGGPQEQIVDPRSIDWSQWNAETMPFRFRQPPGEANALGRVKFMFPNKHAVYLHDTPTRTLFNRSVRAFSHGCVRVDQPVAFADALLAGEEQLNGERIKRLIAGGENGSLPLRKHVPVHLTYFTVWVDEAGEVQKRPDIYGHDQTMKTGLGLGS